MQVPPGGRRIGFAILTASNVGALFVLQLCIYIRVGASAELDAYVAASTIPLWLTNVVTAGFLGALVPMLAGEARGEQSQLAWGCLIGLGVAALSVCTIFASTASIWVAWLFPGFQGATAFLCVELAQVHTFTIFFAVTGVVTTALAYARHAFIMAETVNVIVTAVAALVLLRALPEYGVDLVPWVMVGRAAAISLLLLPTLEPVSVRTLADRSRELFQRAWIRARPLIVGSAYYKMDPLVDRHLLSMSGPADLSLFNLAQQFYSAGTAVIGKSLGTTAIPILSSYSKDKRFGEFNALYNSRLLGLVMLSTACVAILALAGVDGLEAVLSHGELRASSMERLFDFMLGLSGVFVFGCAGIIVAGGFYAQGKTMVPARLSVITFTVSVPLKIVAFNLFGAVGLCVMASAYYCANALLQFWVFHLDRVATHE